VTKLLGLTASRVERDHDLSQQQLPRRKHISIWKRKYVGRTVMVSVLAVQGLNLLIISEQDMNLTRRALEPVKYTTDNAAQRLSRWL
jgi:hypothetical protein